jgi:hypothetical protein
LLPEFVAHGGSLLENGISANWELAEKPVDEKKTRHQPDVESVEMTESKPIWKARRYGILIAAIVGTAVTRTQSMKFWLLVIILLVALSIAEIIVSTQHENKTSKRTTPNLNAKHIGLTILFWLAVIVVSIVIFVFTEKWRWAYR